MITAAREIDTVSRALHGGASDYLVKPFDYTQLQEKLETSAAVPAPSNHSPAQTNP